MTNHGSNAESAAPLRGADAGERGERHFRRLIEGASDVFFVIDRSGTLLYRSEGGQRLTGWDEEEVRGRPLTTFVLPESLMAAHAAIAETLEYPGRFVHVELRMRHKGGAVIDVAAQGRNLLDDPDVRGIVVTAHDITGSKRTERALRESRQVLEAILDAMPARVFWKDLDLVYLGCNAAFARDAGFTDSKQIVGKDDYQMGWREQADRYRGDDRLVIESGVPRLLIEEPQTKPDGSSITLLTSKLPLRGPGGEITGLLGTYLDITLRKQAEEALHASEVRYRRLFESAKDGILILDAATGRIVDVNPFLIELLGFSREQFLDKKVWELGFLGDRLANEANFVELREKGYIRYDDMALKAKDGRRIEVEFVSNRYQVNQAPVIQCNIRDISDRKRAEAATTRLERQLLQAQKMETVGRLAGGVAHDFNNLLGVIVGCGELLSGDLAEGDPRRQDVAEILKAAQQAAGLTRQLLAFSRKQVLRSEVLDLQEIVSNLGKMLRRLVGEDLELVIRVAPDTGRVRADAGQIEQVILNLVVNARDALSPGGRITVETRNVELDAGAAAGYSGLEAGPYVLLEVADTGSGMDAETQARVFEPFFTTKEAGRGTGLGLATVQGIAAQSGGGISLQSELGVGTTFAVLLPRVGEAVEGKNAGRTDPLPRGAETVLLVEDEPALRTLLRRVLESKGYGVLAAPEGQEALRVAAAQAAPIEILVTDVILPGMTGIELGKALQETRPETKVVYLSGYSDESVARGGLTGPGRAFLAKPFGVEAFLRTVRELLDAS